MRILVTTGPAHPLYYPVVPLAWALRAAGHDVLVGVPESFTAAVHSSGLPAAAVCGRLEMAEVMAHDRAGNPITLPKTDEEAVVAVGQGFGRLAARTIEGTCRLVENWRPDIILSEAYSYAAAAAAAARHGVPWVKQYVGPGDMRIHEVVGEELAPELRALGVDALAAPALVLANCPPLLEEPVEEARTIRYVPFGAPDTVPAWTLDRTGGRPRILVTLGSVQPMAGGIDQLSAIVRAVAELPVDVVVAVDDVLVPKMGALPDAVISAGWQALTTVLPACDAVVHHGGPGTMMACLSYGLPQAVIPGRGKPLDAIGRLGDFGAVLRLPENADPAAVQAACRELVAETGYRKRAKEVRDQIAAQASPCEIVGMIEQIGNGAAAVGDTD